ARVSERWTSCRRSALGEKRTGEGTCPYASLALFQLQLALVFLDKSFKVGNGVEQFRPLFVIECHREASESVDADVAFFADPEFDGATSRFCRHLFFEIGQ